jgi:hypothetical protein
MPEFTSTKTSRLSLPFFICNLLIISTLLLNSFSVEAGSVPASWSKVDGVVLGFTYEGENGLYVYFESGHNKEYISKFNDACAQKKRLWALGISNKFVCNKLQYVQEGGDGPVYELKLSTADKRKVVPHAIVFSLTPLETFKSVSRELESTESQALLSVYKSTSLKDAVQNSINNGNIQILEIPEKFLSIYIIKWKHVEAEFSSSDYYLVINSIEDRFFSAGNFEGDIVNFVDINNDGIPEVQVSMHCDGTCEAVTSIYKNTNDFLYIYNH